MQRSYNAALADGRKLNLSMYVHYMMNIVSLEWGLKVDSMNPHLSSGSCSKVKIQ